MKKTLNISSPRRTEKKQNEGLLVVWKYFKSYLQRRLQLWYSQKVYNIWKEHFQVDIAVEICCSIVLLIKVLYLLIIYRYYLIKNFKKGIQYNKKKHAAFSWGWYGRLPYSEKKYHSLPLHPLKAVCL